MRARILIADDEQLERRALSAMVSELPGYDISLAEAANGRQALEAARTEGVDIALLDIRMPGMDGLRCAQELRALYPEIHVVFITAFDEFDYAREALRLGVDEYLVKPAAAEGVKKTVVKLLEKIRQDRARKEASHRAESENGVALSLLEQELRLSLGRGDTLGERLESFLAVKGFQAGPRYALFVRILQAPAQDKDLRRVAVRKTAEEAERFFREAGWYLLTGGGDEDLHGIAVFRGSAGEAGGKDELLSSLLHRLVSDVLSNLGLKILVGAAPSSPDGGGLLFAAAQDAAAIATAEHPAVLLLPDRHEVGGVSKVERAIGYLRAHLAEDLSLADVAAAVGVSPFHLSRLFRLYRGDTFVHVFSRLRVDTAKALLKTGRYSVKEVGGMVGFSDQAYFARVFRKYEGVSPLDFRGA